MKLKKFWSVGGRTPRERPPDPPLQTDHEFRTLCIQGLKRERENICVDL